MIFADIDLFLTLLKGNPGVDLNFAVDVSKRFKGRLKTSETTLIELMFLARRYNLDAVKLMASALSILDINDSRYIQVAKTVSEGGASVFDAFLLVHPDRMKRTRAPVGEIKHKSPTN